MLSILIPFHNDDIAPLIEALLEDAQNLQAKHELLLWDDASTCKFTLPEHWKQHPEIAVHRNAQNLGRTHTRQLLAKAAQYPNLLFLDADMLPVTPGFLQRYWTQDPASFDLISGGIRYQAAPPEPAQYLRWYYGKFREAKPASERQKNPYYVLSSNLYIKKDLFLKFNCVLDHQYGLDNIFSFQLHQHQVRVVHLDNPVYHLGLEEHHAYLQKIKNAIKTLVIQEQEGTISPEFTTLQQAAQKLKRWRLASLFFQITKPMINPIKKQLCGDRPRLFLLDIYKLHHYIALKYHS